MRAGAGQPPGESRMHGSAQSSGRSLVLGRELEVERDAILFAGPTGPQEFVDIAGLYFNRRFESTAPSK